MSARPQLFWYGGPPSSGTERACAERGIILSRRDSPPTAAEFSSARSIVFALRPTLDGPTFASTYGEILRCALWHGLKVFVLVALDNAAPIAAYLRSVRYGRVAKLWERNLEPDVAEASARWNPGPAWSGSVVMEGDEALWEEDKVLLRRAFGDCISAKLVAESAGRSGKVFCVYARLRDSRAGPLPLPFFAKLDRHPKIARELMNYLDFTTLHVPFNQRPNLDVARCAQGAERGIIVGNFIEESETLRELVERGTARAAIHSLFGGALRGWRSQAYFDASNTRNRALAASLEQYLPSTLRSYQRGPIREHARAASTMFGTTLDPWKLEDLLLALPAVEHRCATMHGDLHGENVRVHRSEAILIDFASTTSGPLVADPAALDVALIMGAKSLTIEEWEALARKAYRLQSLQTLPSPSDPTDRDAALWSSIRLIRQIGLADQLSDFEYATAVAVHLLRRAAFRRDPGEDVRRRILTYALAEGLAIELRDVTRRALSGEVTTNRPTLKATGDATGKVA